MSKNINTDELILTDAILALTVTDAEVVISE
jgi:hypothetical protein